MANYIAGLAPPYGIPKFPCPPLACSKAWCIDTRPCVVLICSAIQTLATTGNSSGTATSFTWPPWPPWPLKSPWGHSGWLESPLGAPLTLENYNAVNGSF